MAKPKKAAKKGPAKKKSAAPKKPVREKASPGVKEPTVTFLRPVSMEELFVPGDDQTAAQVAAQLQRTNIAAIQASQGVTEPVVPVVPSLPVGITPQAVDPLPPGLPPFQGRIATVTPGFPGAVGPQGATIDLQTANLNLTAQMHADQTLDDATAGAPSPRDVGLELVTARRPGTAIGKLVLINRVSIELLAASFLALIDQQIQSARDERGNSDEAKEQVSKEIAGFERLKKAILAAIAGQENYAVGKGTEVEAVAPTKTFATTLRELEASKLFRGGAGLAIFGVGMAICHSMGVDPNLGAVTAGALAMGKDFIDVIKAYGSAFSKKK